MTTWRQLISYEMENRGETWGDIESTTFKDDEVDKEFDDGYGSTNGIPFTIWTKNTVYFPWVYDGSESAGSVSRNPDGLATKHVGG
jgi:hypothetical protein